MIKTIGGLMKRLQKFDPTLPVKLIDTASGEERNVLDVQTEGPDRKSLVAIIEIDIPGIREAHEAEPPDPEGVNAQENNCPECGSLLWDGASCPACLHQGGVA